MNECINPPKRLENNCLCIECFECKYFINDAWCHNEKYNPIYEHCTHPTNTIYPDYPKCDYMRVQKKFTDKDKTFRELPSKKNKNNDCLCFKHDLSPHIIISVVCSVLFFLFILLFIS